MSYVLDLHAHSYYSDGKASPAEMVAAAKRNSPTISQMAISDHNTFAGCPEFISACRQNDIEGFVSAEISGSHPEIPDIEFHFLATFAAEWNDSVADRTQMFTPWFNRLIEVDHTNIFRFLAAAASQGTVIPYRQVVREAARFYLENPEGRDPALIKAPAFADLRQVIRDLGLSSQASPDKAGFEADVWRKAGIKPLPTPPITEAYPIFNRARPAVTLAHPMKHRLNPEELKPYIREWRDQIGLIAIEAHYGGQFDPRYKALADELGLLVSVGSDSHSPYSKAGQVPIVETGQADIPALLNALRAAGGNSGSA